jgi:hypothetical protein
MKKIDGWNVIFKAERSQETLHIRTREGFRWTHANKVYKLCSLQNTKHSIQKMLISFSIKETYLFFNEIIHEN